jgi:glycogen debranching enzyme/CRP-like cAMP-binding protein
VLAGLGVEEAVVDPLEQQLRAVPILESIPTPELRQLAETFIIRDYPAGAVIVRHDDADRVLYLLLQGQVSVRQRDDTATPGSLLAEFGPGDFFGEMALLDSTPRSADVVALEETRCALVPWAVFTEEFLGHREVAAALLATMGRRVRSHTETREAIAAALSQVPFLHGLDSGSIRRLAEQTQLRRYAAGVTIVSQDDAGQTLYIVLEGRVQVVRHGEQSADPLPLAEFGPGDFFGEMALLEAAPRSADVRAALPTLCALLDREVFFADLVGNRTVAAALLGSLSQRLRALSELVHQPQVATPSSPRERSRRILRQGESGLAADIRDALVIKEHNHFTLFDVRGDIPIGNTIGLGLYLGDTRHLSGYEVSLGRVQPVVLVSTAQNGYAAEQQLTNRDLIVRRRTIRKETLLISRERLAHDAGFDEVITVRNFNTFAVDVEVVIRFVADFADIFEVRGIERQRRGAHLQPLTTPESVTLRYDGLDKRQYATTLSFTPRPTQLTTSVVSYRESVAALGQLVVRVHVSAVATTDAPIAPERDEAVPSEVQATRARQSYAAWLTETTQITTDNEVFNAAIARSLSDLRLLINRLGDQWYFAAGIPWFATLFGRDSLITGLQTLAWNPNLAAGILRLLARYQGTKDDEWRDEEPGKILHEVRTGELARTGEIPHTPYYGSIDATPLFLILAVAYHDWTGDDALIRDLLPQIEAALSWCERYGDRDGDGYIEYARRSSKGLANQGWKDSGEGIMYRDGRFPRAPLALVEVQGYLFAALQGTAHLFQALGGDYGARATELAARAATLRERFNRDFWMEEAQFYALGLDGAKEQIDAVTSNPGQALWGGIIEEGRAEAVVTRLLSDELFSGWGIRTLGRDNAAYNPLGYHLGTVWPHDNALIAAGMARYGFTDEANRILAALFDAAQYFPYARLPELFCGLARTDSGVPIGYPVACSPQAWAAGSLPFILAEILGLRPTAGGTVLTIDRPIIPAWLGTVRVQGLRVGGDRLDLVYTQPLVPGAPATVVVERQDGDTRVEVRTTGAP